MVALSCCAAIINRDITIVGLARFLCTRVENTSDGVFVNIKIRKLVDNEALDLQNDINFLGHLIELNKKLVVLMLHLIQLLNSCILSLLNLRTIAVNLIQMVYLWLKICRRNTIRSVFRIVDQLISFFIDPATCKPLSFGMIWSFMQPCNCIQTFVVHHRYQR